MDISFLIWVGCAGCWLGVLYLYFVRFTPQKKTIQSGNQYQSEEDLKHFQKSTESDFVFFLPILGKPSSGKTQFLASLGESLIQSHLSSETSDDSLLPIATFRLLSCDQEELS